MSSQGHVLPPLFRSLTLAAIASAIGGASVLACGANAPSQHGGSGGHSSTSTTAPGTGGTTGATAAPAAFPWESAKPRYVIVSRAVDGRSKVLSAGAAKGELRLSTFSPEGVLGPTEVLDAHEPFAMADERVLYLPSAATIPPPPNFAQGTVDPSAVTPELATSALISYGFILNAPPPAQPWNPNITWTGQIKDATQAFACDPLRVKTPSLSSPAAHCFRLSAGKGPFSVTSAIVLADGSGVFAIRGAGTFDVAAVDAAIASLLTLPGKPDVPASLWAAFPPESATTLAVSCAPAAPLLGSPSLHRGPCGSLSKLLTF